MPNYKCILQFAAYTSEWKEIYYVTQGNPALALQLFDQPFFDAALAFRHPAVYIASVTVQDVAQPRSFANFTNQNGPPVVPTTGNTADVKNTCAEWRLASTNNGSSRKLFVRGLLDNDVSRWLGTGADFLNGHLANGMSDYINEMVKRGLSIQSLNPITPGTDPYSFYDIVSITVNSAGRVTLTTEAAAVLTAGKSVILSLFDPKLWPGLKGKFRAKQIALPNFAISYKSVQPANADGTPKTYNVASGHYRNADYRYLAIDSAWCSFVRFGSRNTKSGPFNGRGARRAVRLRSR